MRCRKEFIEEVAASVGETVVAVEAAAGRERLLVPLAGDDGAVSGRAQDLAEGRAVLHAVVADVVGVVAGEELGAGGVALGSVVKLREEHPLLGQLVDVRGLHLATVAADVGIAHVVDHDQNQVWSLEVRLGREDWGKCE